VILDKEAVVAQIGRLGKGLIEKIEVRG